ncbi:MAG: hypothetical protein H0T47_07940 [Planctomycetaceae bacterium]|nr:hypothetical protein [Planctomycetaceae bacterium]
MTLRQATLALALLTPSLTHAADLLTWQELPPLPDEIGFAATYAGVVDGSLVVAGGTNFPDAPPWEDGKKAWYRHAFVLEEPGGSRSASRCLWALPSSLADFRVFGLRAFVRTRFVAVTSCSVSAFCNLTGKGLQL